MGKIDWEFVDGEIAPLYSDGGRPGIATQFVIGLFFLKHIYGLSDEEGRDHVRKYDDVAQRQHRIDSGFTWRKRWAGLCSGHGSMSFLLSLSAATSPSAATTERRWPGEEEYGPPQRDPAPNGQV